MTQSHTVNSELTVTVHSDGTVTWSSASRADLAEIERQIVRERLRASERIDEMDRILTAIRSCFPIVPISVLTSILDHGYPSHPELKFMHFVGVIRIELARALPPKESSPYIATIASTLEAAGYSCTRSRTRVTVRAQAHSMPERAPDFVCTRTARQSSTNTTSCHVPMHPRTR